MFALSLGILRKILRSFIHLCVKMATEAGILALNCLLPVKGGMYWKKNSREGGLLETSPATKLALQPWRNPFLSWDVRLDQGF